MSKFLMNEQVFDEWARFVIYWYEAEIELIQESTPVEHHFQLPFLLIYLKNFLVVYCLR
jgi:hypothetical protein